jgi:hypothetical protein
MGPRIVSTTVNFVQTFSSDQFFWRMVALTLGVKVVLAWLLPFTGDEAYFVVWGNNLDYGYYDHPGMTGWWIWLMLLIDQSSFVVRLPAVLGPLVMAIVIRGCLRGIDPEKANLGGVLFLLSPLNVVNILMTTDTPIFVLSLFSAWFVLRAERGGSRFNYLVGGLFLGAAFFSKYFAVLLGLSYAVYLLIRRRPKVLELFLVFLGVIPWAALNIHWLYHHCWTNVVFNIYNRNQDADFSLTGIVSMAGFALYLLGPPIFYFLVMRWRDDRMDWLGVWVAMKKTKIDLFLVCFLVPNAVFLSVSLVQSVGLHWLIAFYPFVFPVIFVLFDVDGLRRLVKPMAVYTLGQAAIAIVMLLLPLRLASWHDSYGSMIIGSYPDKVIARMIELAPNSLMATPSYAKSALLEFHAGEHVLVVGPSYHHARQDDMVTDFRSLDGQSMVILTDEPDEMPDFVPWFSEHTINFLVIDGARFGILVGEGFRYDLYREQVLRPVAESYYTLPKWLTQYSGSCYFCEKYDLCQNGSDPSR